MAAADPSRETFPRAPCDHAGFPKGCAESKFQSWPTRKIDPCATPTLRANSGASASEILLFSGPARAKASAQERPAREGLLGRDVAIAVHGRPDERKYSFSDMDYESKARRGGSKPGGRQESETRIRLHPLRRYLLLRPIFPCPPRFVDRQLPVACTDWFRIFLTVKKVIIF